MGTRQAITAAALAAAALGAGCGFGSSAKSTTASFFQALSEGKGRDACSYVAPSARAQVLGAMAQGQAQKAAASEGSCDGFARELSSKRKTLFGTVVADPAPSSGGKTVNARFQKEDGSPTVPYSVRLNDRGGDWRVVSVNSGGAP
jgi:hypothetical protein